MIKSSLPQLQKIIKDLIVLILTYNYIDHLQIRFEELKYEIVFDIEKT